MGIFFKPVISSRNVEVQLGAPFKKYMSTLNEYNKQSKRVCTSTRTGTFGKS